MRKIRLEIDSLFIRLCERLRSSQRTKGEGYRRHEMQGLAIHSEGVAGQQNSRSPSTSLRAGSGSVLFRDPGGAENAAMHLGVRKKCEGQRFPMQFTELHKGERRYSDTRSGKNSEGDLRFAGP